MGELGEDCRRERSGGGWEKAAEKLRDPGAGPPNSDVQGQKSVQALVWQVGWSRALFVWGP